MFFVGKTVYCPIKPEVMKILMLQTDIVWESPEQNRDHITEMIYAAESADLIVLPEMFTTGFTMSPSALGEKDGTITLEWMLALARERMAAVAGSIAAEDEGKYYNRFYFVRPDATYEVYDKRHLFAYAGEDREYTAGTGRVVAEYKGVRILLQVCYDLRFPVFSRNRGDFDMILYVANWPSSRIGVWDTLLRARAIENACYVAGVNRVGSDPGGVYDGHTVLVDFKGNPVATAGTSVEETVAGYIDMGMLSAFRAKFPVLNDADGFALDE